MVSFDPYTAQQTCTMPTTTAKPRPKRDSKSTAAASAFECENAAIASYEQGWDRWDGPNYPIGTEQCILQNISPLASEAITSYEEGWDRWDGPVWPCDTEQCELQKFELEVTSYEEGWDRWDGPVWPKGTEQCELQKTAPAFESYEQGWDRWDGPVWPKGTEQCALQSTKLLPHKDQSLPSTPSEEKRGDA